MFSYVTFSVTFRRMKFASMLDMAKLAGRIQAVLVRFHPNFLSEKDVLVEIKAFGEEEVD